MQPNVKQDALKRLNYIEGHLDGIRRMVEQDTYCVDVLKQTYAVRKAIEKLEAMLLEGHLQTCVPEAIREERTEQVVKEMVELYQMAGRLLARPRDAAIGKGKQSWQPRLRKIIRRMKNATRV